LFKDRKDAAYQLAKALEDFKDLNPLILAIPRGGVIIGDIIASKLDAEFDIIVSKKIGAPYNDELAIGAIMHDGSYFPNKEIAQQLDVSNEYFEEKKQIQMKEVERRLVHYRGKTEYDLQNRLVIIVDDGVATGATLSVTALWVKNQNTQKIIIAIPGGAKDTILKLSKIVDEVIALETPDIFSAVSQIYHNFSQVNDNEVQDIMRKHGYKI